MQGTREKWHGDVLRNNTFRTTVLQLREPPVSKRLVVLAERIVFCDHPASLVRPKPRQISGRRSERKGGRGRKGEGEGERDKVREREIM
jgi:hypothetical protein